MFVFQNRRERISERLKVLQELVPNGSKVMHIFTTTTIFCILAYSLDLKPETFHYFGMLGFYSIFSLIFIVALYRLILLPC